MIVQRMQEGSFDLASKEDRDIAILYALKMYKNIYYSLIEKERSIFKEAGANPLLWE